MPRWSNLFTVTNKLSIVNYQLSITYGPLGLVIVIVIVIVD